VNPPIRQGTIKTRTQDAHGLRAFRFSVHNHCKLRVSVAMGLVVLCHVLLEFNAHFYAFSLAGFLEFGVDLPIEV
jgi:hypothetical protein